MEFIMRGKVMGLAAMAAGACSCLGRSEQKEDARTQSMFLFIPGPLQAMMMSLKSQGSFDP